MSAILEEGYALCSNRPPEVAEDLGADERQAAEVPRVTEQLLTVDDVAKILQVGTRTVRRWVALGYLPTAPLPGRVVRIRPEDLRALVGR